MLRNVFWEAFGALASLAKKRSRGPFGFLGRFPLSSFECSSLRVFGGCGVFGVIRQKLWLRRSGKLRKCEWLSRICSALLLLLSFLPGLRFSGSCAVACLHAIPFLSTASLLNPPLAKVVVLLTSSELSWRRSFFHILSCSDFMFVGSSAVIVVLMGVVKWFRSFADVGSRVCPFVGIRLVSCEDLNHFETVISTSLADSRHLGVERLILIFVWLAWRETIISLALWSSLEGPSAVSFFLRLSSDFLLEQVKLNKKNEKDAIASIGGNFIGGCLVVLLFACSWRTTVAVVCYWLVLSFTLLYLPLLSIEEVTELFLFPWQVRHLCIRLLCQKKLTCYRTKLSSREENLDTPCWWVFCAYCRPLKINYNRISYWKELWLETILSLNMLNLIINYTVNLWYS